MVGVKDVVSIIEKAEANTKKMLPAAALRLAT